MIDFEAVRRAYHAPPRYGDHVPSVEERIAAFEHRRVAQARERGIDPCAQALGEHGSLIGGPGKPPTQFLGGRRPEDVVPMPPMPLAWFDHDNARSRTPCADPCAYLDTLAADHLAGCSLRPDGRGLRRLLRAEGLAPVEARVVEQLLARLRMVEMGSLLSRAGLTVYEIARAMHLSGSTVPAKTHWINQFAASPLESAQSCEQPRPRVPAPEFR